MKKILFIMALCVALISCSKNDEPRAQHQVTFNVPALMQVETEPMSAPKRVAPLTDDDGVQMTDLYLFDGETQLVHQQNSESTFGTMTVLLTTGQHNLHFIATRSTGLNYEEGVLSCTSLRSTFGKHYNLNVTGGSDENINMDRLTGQVIITIEDEIPAGAANLHIQFGDYYKGIDVSDFSAIRSGEFNQDINIGSKVGLLNQSWTLNILTPIYDEEYETTYTLTATNVGGAIIGQATGTIPICNNKKTLLHGNLFIGTKSMVALVAAWNSDIDAGF